MVRIFDEWIKPIILALVISGITWFLKEFGGFKEVKEHIISFVVTFSPIIIGFIVFFMYWTIRDYIKLRRFCNKANKWIKLFSYKDKDGNLLYSDLKGKIQCYIREALEENSMLKK